MQKFDEMYTTLAPAGQSQSQSQGQGAAQSQTQSQSQSQSQVQSLGSEVREHYRTYAQWLSRQSADVMRARREEAEMIFRRVGITFAVYGAKDEDGAGTERLIPFDLIPRIIPAHEWAGMEQGLVQRVTALNRFIHDVYHEQEILRAGVIPADQVMHNAQFRPQMMGVDVPNQIYSHISGIDIVRAPNARGEGEYYVLEDNLRVPSGVSYMLEDRKMMMRLFPELFSAHRVAPVAHYPDLLLETLRASSPAITAEPTVVVLTPGMYNSAYFEHAFLAQQMGVELVEGQDLFVKDDFVYMRTTRGPKQVDVIYRRVDDDFLDPQVFRPGSTLGCAGLMEAYRKGHVVICNAVGTGVADDKSIYPYVPKMIEFYLGEKPILSNVPTWMCRDPEDLKYVLANLKDLVVKEVHGAGGYGMLVGPAATQAEIEAFGQAVRANPSGYIAQPTLSLSSCPTFVEAGVAPRHIDLRPFVLSGKEVQMVPGGLTRVALKDGSLVVNSSQGGGTKDTWILEV
ncbi:circularly permuted type 2 ATP-grasp protein [Ramlibacter sp. 2FC]|uniref:circularly permuted type 2 ATP-grasp protein n=1 Tax=Ramlibacter sp. 2FC TaxID=2502188 RepID=UPI00201E127E|nr:circularly permuted type 2 ATP-grasp protein [Ramlibacter sp. 2FC]